MSDDILRKYRKRVCLNRECPGLERPSLPVVVYTHGAHTDAVCPYCAWGFCYDLDAPDIDIDDIPDGALVYKSPLFRKGAP